VKDHRFELIFNTHKNWEDETNIKRTYEWFNLTYETFAESWGRQPILQRKIGSKAMGFLKDGLKK